MSDDTPDVVQPEHHPEVAALDQQIAGAMSDDLSDDAKEKLNALIAERNTIFLQHAPKHGEGAPE